MIIYFSLGGTTKIVARTLEKELNANSTEIIDLKERDGFKNKILASIDAFKETKTKINPMRVDVSDYDIVYFGTPTWANNPSPAIITIMDRCDLRGKDVILFATMSSKGGRQAIRRMEEKVKARGARVIETFTLKTKGKSPKRIVKDSLALIELLDLNLYSEKNEPK